MTIVMCDDKRAIKFLVPFSMSDETPPIHDRAQCPAEPRQIAEKRGSQGRVMIIL